VKLLYCVLALSSTALEPAGLVTKDQAKAVTVVAPEPVVSAYKYTFDPLPTTFNPVVAILLLLPITANRPGDMACTFAFTA
jgi:hypothetical protein